MFRVSSPTLGEVDVEAAHWLVALGEGVTRLGVTDSLDRIAGETLSNGRILVRDVRTGAGFVVQPLERVGEPEDELPLFEADGEEVDVDVEPVELADELLHIRHADDLADAMESAIDGAIANVPSEAGSILLVRGELLAFAVSRGPGWETLANVSFPRGRGVAGFCVEHRTSLVLSEARGDARFFDAVDTATGHVTRSILCVPVAHKDRVYGCIELINAPVSFDRKDLACVDAFAAALGERIARG